MVGLDRPGHLWGGHDQRAGVGVTPGGGGGGPGHPWATHGPPDTAHVRVAGGCRGGGLGVARLVGREQRRLVAVGDRRPIHAWKYTEVTDI